MLYEMAMIHVVTVRVFGGSIVALLKVVCSPPEQIFCCEEMELVSIETTRLW